MYVEFFALYKFSTAMLRVHDSGRTSLHSAEFVQNQIGPDSTV